MDNRRFWTTFLLLTAVWFLLAPRLFPNLFPKPKAPAPAVNVAASEDEDVIAGIKEGESAVPAEIAKHPARTVVLGPPATEKNPDPAWYLRVTTTSRGAAIESAELLDPHFTTLDRKAQLKVVGNESVPPVLQGAVPRQTLQTSVPAIDRQLKAQKLSLADVDWEVVSEGLTAVVYRYRAPDGSVEVRKKYELKQGDPKNLDTDVTGYLLGVELTIQNLKQEAVKSRYRLIGPTGLPLDDPDNARTYIELKGGTFEDPADQDNVTAVSLTASAVVSQLEKVQANNDPAALTVWRKPLRYAGADVQYFAALLVPGENQAVDADKDGAPEAYFAEARPIVVGRNTRYPDWSNVSLEFTSKDFDLPVGGSVTHKYDMFLGPKRSALLDAIGARPVMNYGWWRHISNGLLAVLNFYHNTLHMPYWLSIIMLTVAVRACMFPISLRQTAGAQKMKELQPELAELRKKYSKEPEKFALAQRDLFRKHNYNPFAGCLPIFLQLPIFIGLYNALYYAVDLRLARFLWVDNLAAPDALFKFGFNIPFLNWNEFNLLPLITVGLFLVQQKLFMPPPATDEQRMQNKMMNFMTVFMGLLFYKSPAGLCIYFIASSLWGICERKVLDKMRPQLEARAAAKAAAKAAKRGDRPAGKTWLEKLVAAADEARKQTNGRAGDQREAEKSGKTRR